MFSNYGKLSTEVYELTKPIGFSIDGDIEYYESRLQNKTGTILEAGVGTGRVFLPLLQKGYPMEGVDYSQHMLTKCKEHCDKEKLSPILYQQDLIHLDLPQTYDVIMMPTGSFCLITQRDNALKVLRNFYNHLSPNGTLLLDLDFPFDFIPQQSTTSIFPLTESAGIRMEVTSLEMDWIAQTTETIIKYEKWDSGHLVESELQNFTLVWYGLEEFKMMLEHIGFTNITISADYHYQQPCSKNTQIITFEATK